MVLALHGHDVAVARTGPEGVEAAERVRPDVVLSDIGLPGFSGYEVARRIRQGGGAGALLVALTAYGQDADRAAAYEAGFNLHIAKPADPAEVVQMLAAAADWLAGRRDEPGFSQAPGTRPH